MVMEQMQVVLLGSSLTKCGRGFCPQLHLSPHTEPSLEGPVAFVYVCVSQRPCAGIFIPRAMAGSVRGGQFQKTVLMHGLMMFLWEGFRPL